MQELIGRTLSDYHVLEQIGRGGMARVFKARDLKTDRTVAVKVLAPQLAIEETFRARFHREAKVLSELRHPHIVPILDYGESHGLTYIVMPFMQVGGLDDYLQNGPLAVQDGARIIEQVSSALQFAHDRGVVHRDVKPSNILIDEHGNAWLSDFGFAHVHDATVSLTGSALIGTPAYMAPEQVLGQAVSPLTDQYALGVILYQICTGSLPFDAETPMAIALKHAGQSLPRPRSVNPNLPDAVEQVLIRVLAKEPEHRYASVVELNKAFTDALSAAVDLAAGGIKPGARSRVLEHPEVIPVLEQSKPPAAVEVESVESKRRPVAALLLLALLAPLVCLGSVKAYPVLMAGLGDDPSNQIILSTQEVRATSEVLSTEVSIGGGPSLAPEEIHTAVAATLTAMAADQDELGDDGSPTQPTTSVLSATEQIQPPGWTPGDTPSESPPAGTTSTPTLLVSLTPTRTPTWTPTLLVSLTPTRTPGWTPTPTRTTTAYASQTAGWIATVTSTPIPITATPTRTATRTGTATNIVPSKTPSATTTQTVFPIITSTNSTIVTATPKPSDTCEKIGVGLFSHDDEEVKWRIGNGNPFEIRLIHVYLKWPEENKALKLVTLSGRKLWGGEDDDPPSSISLPTDGISDNVIPPTSVAPLEFLFAEDALPAGYYLVLEFGNGCKVSFAN